MTTQRSFFNVMNQPHDVDGATNPNDTPTKGQQPQQPSTGGGDGVGTHSPDMSTSMDSFSSSLSPASTNIIVAGLPTDFDDCRLRALFSAFGQIQRCRIMLDTNTGFSKGFGFVLYKEPAEATKAIEVMNGKKLNSQDTQALYVALSHHVETAAENEEVQVRNVPPYVGSAELKQAFEQYGEVEECNVVFHPPPDGRSKGTGTVKFKELSGAKRAVEMAHGTRPFGPTGKPLVVRYAETDDARKQRQGRQLKRSQHVVPVTNAPVESFPSKSNASPDASTDLTHSHNQSDNTKSGSVSLGSVGQAHIQHHHQHQHHHHHHHQVSVQLPPHMMNQQQQPVYVMPHHQHHQGFPPNHMGGYQQTNMGMAASYPMPGGAHGYPAPMQPQPGAGAVMVQMVMTPYGPQLMYVPVTQQQQ